MASRAVRTLRKQYAFWGGYVMGEPRNWHADRCEVWLGDGPCDCGKD